MQGAFEDSLADAKWVNCTGKSIAAQMCTSICDRLLVLWAEPKDNAFWQADILTPVPFVNTSVLRHKHVRVIVIIIITKMVGKVWWRNMFPRFFILSQRRWYHITPLFHFSLCFSLCVFILSESIGRAEEIRLFTSQLPTFGERFHQPASAWLGGGVGGMLIAVSPAEFILKWSWRWALRCV